MSSPPTVLLVPPTFHSGHSGFRCVRFLDASRLLVGVRRTDANTASLGETSPTTLAACSTLSVHRFDMAAMRLKESVVVVRRALLFNGAGLDVSKDSKTLVTLAQVCLPKSVLTPGGGTARTCLYNPNDDGHAPMSIEMSRDGDTGRGGGGMFGCGGISTMCGGGGGGEFSAGGGGGGGDPDESLDRAHLVRVSLPSVEDIIREFDKPGNRRHFAGGVMGGENIDPFTAKLEDQYTQDARSGRGALGGLWPDMSRKGLQRLFMQVDAQR